jgi:hypothetical protein
MFGWWNEVEWNVMVPFHWNGLVSFSCSVEPKKWNGTVPSGV